jgi:uncharacterized membrane protein YfhO
LSEYLPNCGQKSLIGVPQSGATGTKKVLEFLLDHCSPEKLNNLFEELTARRWKRLYKSAYNKNDFDVVFKSNQHVSKNHPRNFQKKVLTIYQQKVNEIDQKLAEINSIDTVKSAV